MAATPVAATIASRTCGVRSLTGVIVFEVPSSISVTVIVTVIVSVRLPSEAVIVTV